MLISYAIRAFEPSILCELYCRVPPLNERLRCSIRIIQINTSPQKRIFFKYKREIICSKTLFIPNIILAPWIYQTFRLIWEPFILFLSFFFAKKKRKETCEMYVSVWLQTEVEILGKLNHPNIVLLIGCCNEGDHRILVYEYMSKGSLDILLFRGECPSN